MTERDPGPIPAKPPQNVRVVERAVDILNCFLDPQDSLSLQQIVERSGLQKATAFRIATTLARAGILAQTAPGSAYSLGYLTQKLPHLIRVSSDIGNAVRPALQEVRDLVNETVVLAIRADNDTVNIDKADSTHLIDETPTMGVRRPLHETGAGLAILMSFDRTALAAYCRSLPESGTLAALDDILNATRSHGLVTLPPDEHRRHAQVSAPLVTPGGRAVGALSVTIPENRLTAKLLARCELHLKASADAIGTRL
jgi:DNA-binding IclR family transcriptional regulator